MSGENGGWLTPPSAQPGGRDPAPGDLALVQAFINSHYDLELEHGADLFATPQALRRWLLDRGLIGPRTRVERGELERALDVREGLRLLAAGNDPSSPSPECPSSLNAAAAGACIEVRLTEGGPRFVPQRHGGVPAALGLVLALTAKAMLEGTWSRLKICPGEDCGWAFYDHSRNQTGRWCSMSVCGGRAKARTHYRRRRGAS